MYPVRISCDQDRMVVVSDPVFQRLRQVDFHAMQELQAVLLAQHLFGYPAARKPVFRGRERFHAVTHGEIHIIGKRRTGIQQAVVGMQVVQGVILSDNEASLHTVSEKPRCRGPPDCLFRPADRLCRKNRRRLRSGEALRCCDPSGC